MHALAYIRVLVQGPLELRLHICVLVQDPPGLSLPSHGVTTLYMLVQDPADMCSHMYVQVQDPQDVYLPSHEVTIIYVGMGSSKDDTRGLSKFAIVIPCPAWESLLSTKYPVYMYRTLPLSTQSLCTT